jgi:hypothetical protein
MTVIGALHCRAWTSAASIASGCAEQTEYIPQVSPDR